TFIGPCRRTRRSLWIRIGRSCRSTQPKTTPTTPAFGQPSPAPSTIKSCTTSSPIFCSAIIQRLRRLLLRR
ncbi:hypothetical protein HK102_007254, partial [Quaeritorhiza haematococci]